MVAPQGGKSGIRRTVERMTSSRAGKDDFGVRSCWAFAIGTVLFWPLIYSGILAHGYNGWLQFVLTMVWVLAICGAVLLGAGFAFAGVGRAIGERRVPIFSIIGIILNVLPSAFLFLALFFRA